MIPILLALLPALVNDSNDIASARAQAARTLQSGLAQERGDMLLEAEAAREALGNSLAAQRLAASLQAARSAQDPSASELELRATMKRVAEDLLFVPLLEAGLPAGWPTPTLVGEVELKDYPAYRMARTRTGITRSTGAFWTLFRHITSNEIAMTAPVEMTYGSDARGLRETAMAFLYGSRDIGEVGERGSVDVLDVEPARALSLGCRGRASSWSIAEARKILLDGLASRPELEASGDLRVMGYNGPSVATSRAYFEVQLPVRPRVDETLQDSRL